MDTPAMTELEERLASPSGKAVRKDILERLDAIELVLRTKIAAGLSPREFADGQAASDAVAAARELVLHWPHQQ